VYPNQPHLQTADTVELIDTHCHLDCEPLRLRLPEILTSARRAGVTRFVVPGVHPEDWQRMADMAGAHAGVFCAFGVHPMHADLADGASLSRLEGIAGNGVAIGEIGLDPTYQVSLVVQEQAFREQLRLAVALGLPVLVHCRHAFKRTLNILREEKANLVGGIMHAFSGSPEMAREFILLGFAIALSGTVTWKGAVRPLRLAREIPLESLVLETDAPDMTPQAMRGKPNEPAWLLETLQSVAQIRGISVTEVATAALHTTRKVLTKIS
jgi:TatD DNase family protein